MSAVQLGRAVNAVGRAVGWLGREVGWWLSSLARLLRTVPRLAAVWLVAALTALWVDAQLVLACLLMLPLLLGSWARSAPVGFERWLARPVWRARLQRSTRRLWPGLMEACHLGHRVVSPAGQTGLRAPALDRVEWRGDQLVLRPRLLLGQTVEDLQAVADRVRVSLGARRVAVVANGAGTGCELRLMFGDPLAHVVEATLPPLDAPVQLEAAVMGRLEDGTPWRLPLRVSTLVAGSSGAGKASAMWLTMAGWAPAIRAGLVQVVGIDLKGGMELAMGRALFTRTATTLPEAVEVLEDTAVQLQARARRLAGVVRTHQPSRAEPLVVVLVDELAALTCYSTDRDLLKRADAALRVILSQGRAPGFYVVGFLQDPRKETVPMRHLFPQAFALRLREPSEVAMVLSDGAVAAGAACHKITASLPGVGYWLDETGQVRRVRLDYVPDQLIRQLAVRFPTPTVIPVRTEQDPHSERGETPQQGEPGEHPAARVRSPRKPRTPRQPRGTTGTNGDAAPGSAT